MPDEIQRRWSKPPEILSVKDSSREVVVENGKPHRGVDITLSRDSIDRVREGRMCIKCLEPQSEPFPEKCQLSLCGFPIRKEQPRLFERYFEGETHLGPSYDVEAELNRLDGEAEELAWQAHPTTGIVVPPGVSLN